ncbi:MAG: nickel-dependent hydrogenase large subunit [Anaerolineales bacterium]|nr:nickel-dependent hydrogenase large subunit [Anaerolineales bacterium]
MTVESKEKFIIPIGPQHPALKEPAHFEFSVEGETVTSSSVRFGYVHRGIEKGAENRNWAQTLYLVERICGICSNIHSTAYSLAVEKLAGVPAPPRAQAIRQVLVELERIHSHMLWAGVGAHEAGFDTLFMYSWRDRETVMDILESTTGNRVNYSSNILGGVKYDITPPQVEAILKGVAYLEERLHYYMKIVTSDETFLQRTRGVGVMNAAEAEKLGVTGPTARASGIARDTRVDAPYLLYEQHPVTIVLSDVGDLQARFVVRIQELFESIRVIRELVRHLPEGELSVRFPRRVREGETVMQVEAPRGDLFYFIKSDGGERPYRVKVRTPSLRNFTSVLEGAIGQQLADVPMILAGIDPCFSCNDRSVVFRRNGETAGTS